MTMMTSNTRCVAGSNSQLLRTGFTLVEVLVVISIIVLLISILLPSMGLAKERGRQAVCASNLKQLGYGITSYAGDSNDRVPPLRESGGVTQTVNHWPRWFREPGDTRYWNLGYLFRFNYITDGLGYFCPSQRLANFTYQTHANPVFPSDVTCAGCSNGVRLPYYYNPMTVSLSDRNRKYTQLRQMTSSVALAFDTIEGDAAIAHFNAPGWNVMAGDTSTVFVKSPSVRADIQADPGGLAGTNFVLFDQVIAKLMAGR